jgi:pectate lyase
MVSAVVTNKTIIGLKGARLINNVQTASGSGILYFKSGSKNVILRNITFEGPGAYDVDGNDNFCHEGTYIWVDHCTFQDGMDGNFDQKHNCDNVTVSWCRFQYLKPPKAGGSGGADDHRFCGLVGSSSSDAPADGKFSITWKNCWWDEGCVERMSRARNADMHYLNCYWNSSVAHYYLGLETCPNVYVENSVMVGSSVLDYKSYGDPNNVKFVNCTTNNGADVGSATKPSYSYTAAALSGTVSACTSGAGAILNVSSSGQVQ